MAQINQTPVSLPTDLVDRLNAGAKALGMDVSAYLSFLENCRNTRLDAKAQDAVKFMFTKHADSLRKLAQ